MGIAAEDFKRCIIQPTLQRLGVQSAGAEALLLATAAVESELGSFLKAEGQRTSGVYQMHGLTHRHIWDDYLGHQPELASKVRGLASQHDFLTHPHAELTTNLSYATAIALLAYLRHPEFVLPDNPTPELLAELWKQYYHPRDDLSIADFIARYKELIRPMKVAAA
ncbi:MAG: hypothetical protein VB954_07085 [Thalassolituus sp.]|uniref:Uncharacterized protein n=1 Tax=Thalassolituus oleivorans MIL-1 TaxID=1298593 RepID=M5DSB5_9GAMM|nr:hypothetical protein [Thalassolituus oleivorans]AHK15693.1 hypothetical protein R615_07690 [Thalassolituus oleivorans R6-15]APR66931.1 hypothetical protein CN03_08290 [Thalassolituus oleivorans]MBQ0728383.1 hypothetical protein [Thalassolituus oleivorans]MBQ0781114.1 hypothetical protein [Thalassolituus oleivorans]MCA6128826.1 hypothetical protein [Thalassolituus oleivorans 4BN06-13]|tara:strand:- start:1075 stop:1572 length:498 start_codon:yes stop_codon:yes gene_type:complete